MNDLDVDQSSRLLVWEHPLLETRWCFRTIDTTAAFLRWRCALALLTSDESRAAHFLGMLFSMVVDVRGIISSSPSEAAIVWSDLKPSLRKDIFHDHFDHVAIINEAATAIYEASRLPEPQRKSLHSHYERIFASLYDEGCECSLCTSKGSSYGEKAMEEAKCLFSASGYEDFMLASSIEGISSELGLMDMDPTLFDVYRICEAERASAISKLRAKGEEQKKKREESKKSADIVRQRFGPKQNTKIRKPNVRF